MLIRLLILLLPSLWPSAAHAEKTLDLFSSTSLVVNQTAAVRRTAAVDGLAAVFVRLSGSSRVLEHPSVRAALARASDYLYEFSYQSTEEQIALAGTQYPATELTMKFTQAPLEQLLRRAQLPLWSANRPDVLIWAAIKQGSYDYLSSDLSTALAQAASRRGIPLSEPVLDLEDRQTLPVARIWAIDEGRIRLASKRYATDVVLAGRIDLDSRRLTGSFILLQGAQSHYFTVVADSQHDIARELIDQVADYLAGIYATVPHVDNERSLMLQVSNVASFADYAQVLSYLENFTLIEQLHLSQVNGENLVFNVKIRGELNRFLNALALEKKLGLINTNRPLPTLPVSLPANTSQAVIPPAADAMTLLEFEWL